MRDNSKDVRWSVTSCGEERISSCYLRSSMEVTNSSSACCIIVFINLNDIQNNMC